MSTSKVAVDNGKYTFEVPDGDWRVHVKRHEEPWLVIEQGSKAIAAMASELADAKELIEAVLKWNNSGRDPEFAKGKHGNLYAAIERYCSVRGIEP